MTGPGRAGRGQHPCGSSSSGDSKCGQMETRHSKSLQIAVPSEPDSGVFVLSWNLVQLHNQAGPEDVVGSAKAEGVQKRLPGIFSRMIFS